MAFVIFVWLLNILGVILSPLTASENKSLSKTLNDSRIRRYKLLFISETAISLRQITPTSSNDIISDVSKQNIKDSGEIIQKQTNKSTSNETNGQQFPETEPMPVVINSTESHTILNTTQENEVAHNLSKAVHQDEKNINSSVHNNDQQDIKYSVNKSSTVTREKENNISHSTIEPSVIKTSPITNKRDNIKQKTKTPKKTMKLLKMRRIKELDKDSITFDQINTSVQHLRDALEKMKSSNSQIDNFAESIIQGTLRMDVFQDYKIDSASSRMNKMKKGFSQAVAKCVPDAVGIWEVSSTDRKDHCIRRISFEPNFAKDSMQYFMISAPSKQGDLEFGVMGNINTSETSFVQDFWFPEVVCARSFLIKGQSKGNTTCIPSFAFYGPLNSI